MLRLRCRVATLFLGCLSLFALTFSPGCERKEKIIEVETPRRKIEVERSKDSGDVDVEIEKKK